MQGLLECGLVIRRQNPAGVNYAGDTNVADRQSVQRQSRERLQMTGQDATGFAFSNIRTSALAGQAGRGALTRRKL